MKSFISLIFTCFVFVVVLTNCSPGKFEENQLGNFDISPDGRNIVFSYYKNGISSVCKADVNGSNVVLLFNEKDSSFVNPRYSLNGDKIIFICHAKDKLEGQLYISDSDGKSKKLLVREFGIITEGVFVSENKVVFCSANEYSSPSGISPKNAHGFDLYSVNLENNEIKKLTSLNLYGLNSLTRIDTSNIFIRKESGEGGIFKYSLIDNKLDRIVAKNISRNPDLYSSPSYSQKVNTLSFTAPYQLYTMSLSNMSAKLIYDSKYDLIKNTRFENNSIFFSESGSVNEIFKFDLDSDSLTKISFANLK